jgi:hypothetical protein
MERQDKSTELAAYWQQQVAGWQASGQSQKAFCEANDLNFHRLGYWRRKLLQRADSGSQQDSGFVPVTLHSQPVPTALSIRLPNGLMLQGITRDNLPLVYQLLSRLS